jgi:hypothetical protein
MNSSNVQFGLVCDLHTHHRMATGSQNNMWALVNAFRVISEYRERRWTKGFDCVDLLMCRTNEWTHAVLHTSFVFSLLRKHVVSIYSFPKFAGATWNSSADTIVHADD